jgi:hypothetical protein
MKKNLPLAIAVMLICILHSGFVNAQNLVLNPSFEITSGCPAGISEFALATNWSEGNTGQVSCSSTDLYAGCSSQIGGANSPNALLGFQQSRTGDHHAGIILGEGALACVLSGSNYREYMEGTLASPLVAGQKYLVRFYMSLPDGVMAGTDDFGVYFSNTFYSRNACAGQPLLPLTPQLNYCGAPILDTLNWVEVRWIYQATGGEQYFIIGNFKNDANTTLAPHHCTGFIQNPYIYYFIDDVEISPIPQGVQECSYTVVANTTNAGCSANNGSAQVTVNGCTSPYTYAWSNGGNTASINNVAAGNYTVTVSDANCSVSTTVSISAYTAPSVQLTTINANCGASNGVVIANPAGTGPFTYAWSNSNTTQAANNLGAGTYTVTVTGAGNCSASASASITASAGSLTLTGNTTPASCGINNGTAAVSVTGGSGSYTYNWSNNATTQSVSGLAPGTYTVTVSGSSSGNTPFWSEYFTSGGTGWTFANGPGTNGAQPNGWIVNNYQECECDSGNYLHVTCNPASFFCTVDPGSCSYFAGTPIPNPLLGDPTADKVAISPAISTVGKSNMVLKFKYQVGGDANDYCLLRFSGDGGATWTDMPTKYFNQFPCTVTTINVPNTFENKPDFRIGFRWINNNDANGDTPGFSVDNIELSESTVANCPSTTTVTVGTSNTLQVSASNTSANCGQNNGTATAVVPGGSGYIYVWNTGGNTPTINNLGAGTYSVTVSAGANCSATASTVVTASNGLSISTQAVNASCGGNSGSATVTVSGVGNYNYNWSNGANTATAANLAPGTYNVTVSQGNCSATASATIVSGSGLSGTFTVTQPSCGQANGAITANNITAGVQPISYEWELNNITISTSAAVSNLGSGVYVFHATDANGCSLDTGFILNSTGLNGVQSTTDKNVMCAGDSANVCAPAGYSAYLWNTGATSQCIKVKAAGNYYVTVTDGGNCTATSSPLAISVRPQPPVSVSINGDTLTSYNAASYQWYRDGQLIPGATTSIYVPTQGGSYQVLVSDTAGCKALSNAIVITGTEDLADNSSIAVFPNPTLDGWYIDITTDLINATAQLYDNNGRLVHQVQLVSTRTAVDFDAAQGIYLLRISNNNRTVSRKLIKL